LEPSDVLHHNRDKVAPLLPFELPKSRRTGQRYPFPSDWPKIAGQTVDQFAAALVVNATSLADIRRDVAKGYDLEAGLPAQIDQPETASRRTMRHRVGYGKDAICGENAADFRQERQFWQIDERLDIDRDIDACAGERQLEGMPLQMGDCGIAVPPVPKCRQRSIDPDRRLRRERGMEVSETSASAAAYLEQPCGLGCACRSLNRLRYLGIKLNLMGLVRPNLRHGIIARRIAVVEGRYLLPLRQAIGAVVNIPVQPVRCAHSKAGTDETLEDAERRQCREDSCLIAGAGISAPSRPVQRHGRGNSPTMSA
jgi:hypothetical protein